MELLYGLLEQEPRVQGESIEAGTINSGALSYVEPWDRTRLRQRGGTGHVVSRLPASLGDSQLPTSLTLDLNLGRVTND